MPGTRFQGKYFSIQEDDSGTEFVSTGNAVLVVPLTAARQVITVIETSPAFGGPTRLLPGGEISSNEMPEDSANRELQEEIGFRAGRLDFLGELRPFSKYLTVRVYVFLARDLVPSKLAGDETEIIEQVPLPLESIAESISAGVIKDSSCVAALFMALAFLRAENQ